MSRDAAQFRSRQRFPCLVYFDKHSGASISRASQPLGGITSRRNAKDENLIRAIYDANTNGTELRIIDCRSRMAAMGNVRADQSDEEARLLQAFSEGVDGVLQVRASGAAAKIELTLKLSNETIGPGDPGADNRAVSGKVRGVATATWSGADGNQVQASLELVQPFTTMGRSSMREHLAKTLGEGLSDALLQKLAAR